MTTATPPRRNWHLQRWLLVLAAGLLAYGGWTTYAFRAALAETKALGWEVSYTDPVEEIRKNWKEAFKKETWSHGGVLVGILTSEEFEQHAVTMRRLNPAALVIYDASSMRDLSLLKCLPSLIQITIFHGSNLTNLDALKDLKLEYVQFGDCPALTDLNGLRNLKKLKDVQLSECNALTNLAGLENHTELENIWITACDRLTNVDELKGLVALKNIGLTYCTGLTNVDALKHLPALQSVDLAASSSLTKESIAALKAALPNAEIGTEHVMPVMPDIPPLPPLGPGAAIPGL